MRLISIILLFVASCRAAYDGWHEDATSLAQLHSPPNSDHPIQLIPSFNVQLIPSTAPYLMGSFAYTVPDHACSPPKITGPASHWQGRRLTERIVLVDGGGGCNLETKVNNILKSLADIGIMDHGLTAVIVRFNSESLSNIRMEAQSVMAKQQQPLYDVPILLCSESEFDALDAKVGKPASIHLYKPRNFDSSLFVMWALAVATVAFSARHAANLHPLANQGTKDHGVDIVDDWWAAIVLVSVACTLGLLSWFPNLVFKLLQIFFMFVGGIQLCSFFHSVAKFRFPMYKLLARRVIYHQGQVNISLADVASWVFGFGISLLWYIHRMDKGVWFWQDIVGVACLVQLVKWLPLADLTICANLLSIAFMYNAFWVYYQLSDDPLRQGMELPNSETLTTAEPVPYFLRIPNINDRHGGESILGFGDILLPGLVVAFARAWDIMMSKDTSPKRAYTDDSKQRRPYNAKAADGLSGPWWVTMDYFQVSTLGYAAGLFLPYLFVASRGINFPPLLTTIPGTILPIMYMAYKRRQLDGMWVGTLHPTNKAKQENGHAHSGHQSPPPQRSSDDSV